MNWRMLGVCVLFVSAVLYVLTRTIRASSDSDLIMAPLEAAEPAYQFGFNLDSFHIEEFAIEPGAMMGELLLSAGVPYPAIHQLVEIAKDSYSVRKIRAGKKCALIRDAGSCNVECFVYEPDVYSYVKYLVGDKVDVEVVEREVESCIEASSGVITSSLWDAMDDVGHSWELIDKMEDALAWAVDLHHIQKDDEFRLVYEQKYIDGQPVGVGRLLGAYYNSGSREYYSIYYDTGHGDGYYDLEGHSMKRAFLKAPVKYSRISSRYSNRRFHPVLKRYKGHYGTDYAAPYGTPIVAVADGVVSKAEYKGGNGNYVKIRHDKVYETQYLHMQKFASGIRPGTHVKQNQVIGYVGSTGLATGPHVCFRFWKNGKQVDHMKEYLPNPEPMRPEDLPGFTRVKASVLPLLQDVAINTQPTP